MFIVRLDDRPDDSFEMRSRNRKPSWPDVVDRQTTDVWGLFDLCNRTDMFGQSVHRNVRYSIRVVFYRYNPSVSGKKSWPPRRTAATWCSLRNTFGPFTPIGRQKRTLRGNRKTNRVLVGELQMTITVRPSRKENSRIKI